MRFSAKAIVRFWSKVDLRSHEECWPWLGRLNDKGYGRILVDYQHFFAHRMAWMLFSDQEIPSGLMVRHHCDNPRCVNPAHLAIGTALDNARDAQMRDRVRGRGRGQRGERHGRAKFTDDVVRAIRSSTEPNTVIAARYGVNRSTVSKLKRGVRWQHVT